MRNEPKVGIVLLNWNNYADTADCLDSLSEITYENSFIVVVDNGSDDNSGERLANDYEWCDFVFNDDNLGFSGGCNVGIEHALENGAEYVLLLNNDIEVSSDFLEPLVETAESHDRVAAVGGVIYEGRSEDVWDAGGEMRPLIANVTRYNEVKSENEYQTEFVTCAQALLSKEFLQEYRLDEEYFFGVEEIDLSWRARDEGWKLFTNPNSEVYHDVGGSTEELFEGANLFSSFQKYHNTRGRLYFAKKNLGPPYSISYYIASVSLFPAFYAWLGIRYGRWDILKAHLRSIYDFISDNEIMMPSDFD